MQTAWLNSVLSNLHVNNQRKSNIPRRCSMLRWSRNAIRKLLASARVNFYKVGHSTTLLSSPSFPVIAKVCCDGSALCGWKKSFLTSFTYLPTSNWRCLKTPARSVIANFEGSNSRPFYLWMQSTWSKLVIYISCLCWHSILVWGIVTYALNLCSLINLFI